jgi:hypothetical protein
MAFESTQMPWNDVKNSGCLVKQILNTRMNSMPFYYSM